MNITVAAALAAEITTGICEGREFINLVAYNKGGWITFADGTTGYRPNGQTITA